MPNLARLLYLELTDDKAFDHDVVSAELIRPNAEHARTGKPYTLEVEESIQRKTMLKGGMKEEHIDEILKLSREELKRQGALEPTRTPGTRRGR